MEFVVIVRPPAGEPQTFEDTNLDAEGNQVPVTRDKMRHITVNAADEDAARRLVQKQQEAVAQQELEAEDAASETSKYAEDPDLLDQEVAKRAWVIESITPFDPSVGSDSYPAGHPSAAREDVPEPEVTEQVTQQP